MAAAALGAIAPVLVDTVVLALRARRGDCGVQLCAPATVEHIDALKLWAAVVPRMRFNGNFALLPTDADRMSAAMEVGVSLTDELKADLRVMERVTIAALTGASLHFFDDIP